MSSNLITEFLVQVDARTDAPFLWSKQGEAFQARSWRQVRDDVAALAGALAASGIEPGDRVMLVSENRPEWFVADMAIMSLGAITVPAYTTNTERDHLHICENSGAKAAIVSTARLAQSLIPAAHQSDALQTLIAIEAPELSQTLNFTLETWGDYLSRGADNPVIIETQATRIEASDIACLIYTSGTGGAPKGVMIHHGAILHNCRGAKEVLDRLDIQENVFLSFLPLSHAYEHTAGQFLPMIAGGQIYYAENLDKLATNMAEARPEVMVVVPRLFEMLRQRILRGIEKEGGLKKTLFDKTLSIGAKRLNDPDKLSLADRMLEPLLALLIKRKVQARFGGRIQAMVSGGAPLNPDVGVFFTALGLPLLQGYGQTEAGPVISVNRPGAAKMHTVGPPMPNTDVKIADDGEILVRGELVMNGYWRDEAATESTIREGWLHTGDVGILDRDGHIQITDRKKDIIVLDKGDNVSPQRIEGMLTLEAEISQAMIWGDRRPYLVAVLVPDAEWLMGWEREGGKSGDLEALQDDPDLRRKLSQAVDRVNAGLSSLEKVRRFIIGKEAFTVENEQMTPTLKVRRHVVGRAYERQLSDLYGSR